MATPLRAVRRREYQLLTEAHRARSEGHHREALRLYRRVLVENPRSVEVALRVAPMLACAGEAFEAWQLYRRAALEYARARQYAECLAVYREACRFVPREFEAWRLCAELQLKLGNADGAKGAANLLWLNDGKGTFTAAPPGALPDHGERTTCLLATDLDGDGRPELVVGNARENGARTRVYRITAAAADRR